MKGGRPLELGGSNGRPKAPSMPIAVRGAGHSRDPVAPRTSKSSLASLGKGCEPTVLTGPPGLECVAKKDGRIVVKTANTFREE